MNKQIKKALVNVAPYGVIEKRRRKQRELAVCRHPPQRKIIIASAVVVASGTGAKQTKLSCSIPQSQFFDLLHQFVQSDHPFGILYHVSVFDTSYDPAGAEALAGS